MKILKKRGQGATEYLLMLAAVLVIVAVAVFYIMRAGPTATITGSATIKSGDNTVVVFTPTSMVGTPKTVPAADWAWKVYRGAELLGEGTPTVDLAKNVSVELDCGTNEVAIGDVVKLWYKGTSIGDSATVA